MSKLDMPLDKRMLPIYTAFTKWLIETGNQELLISYDQFEIKFIELILQDDAFHAELNEKENGK